MIKINMIGAQSFQALVQVEVEILQLFYVIQRALGGNVHLIPDGFESLAHRRFAVLVAVEGRGVEIIDPQVIGVQQHFGGLFLIHFPAAVFLLNFGQAHAAKA